MEKNLNQKLSMKKQVKINYLLFLPIIALLVLVPLIVRLVVFEGSDILRIAYKKDELIDFYSQGKAMAIRLITIAMGIIIMFCYRKKELKKSKEIAVYAVAAGVYSLLTVVATVFSKYPDVALWGAPDRAEGLIILISYIAIMFYTLYAVKSTDQYSTIMFALGLLVVISTVIGVFQYAGVDLFTTEIGKKIIIPNKYAELREQLKAQFPSQYMTLTMFNPNYVGSFSAMMLPLFIVPVFFKIELKSKIAALIFAACTSILLIGCNSRAGFIGVITSAVLAAIIFSKKVFQKKQLIIGGMGMLVGLLLIAHIMTHGLLLKRMTMLVGDGIKFFATVDKDYDYRENLTVRDILTTQDNAVIILKDHNITVQIERGTLAFSDERNQSIAYELNDDVYVTQDEKFKAIKFLNLYMEAEGQLGGFGLIVDEALIFAFEIAQEGIYMIDPYTQERIEHIDAQAIGFWGKENLGSGRGYIWSRSIPILKKTLWLGSGPDTFIFEFPQDEYFAKWHVLGNPLVVVDKPHNMYLQIGINQGVIALLAFLILIISYIVESVKLYAFRSDYKKYTIGGIAVMLAIVSYVSAAVFNDSTVSVAPLFWVLLGVGMAFNYIVKKHDLATIK